jgi:porphobilinogen synthase
LNTKPLTHRSPIGHSHKRPRRLRATRAIRDLVEECTLKPSDLLYPVFVTECEENPEPIASLPGQARYPLKDLQHRIQGIAARGIQGVMLFPVNQPRHKDPKGSYALDSNSLICKAIQACREASPETLVFADIALDPFTDHGHDGVLAADGTIDNDETVAILAEMSINLARAGCSFVCPSDMMDGRIAAIRSSLDDQHFQQVGILSYTAKYASAYYGPFRDAVGQTARNLDKSTYQLPPSSRRQALLEATLDEAEGADIMMVKPGGPYLDILRDLRDQTTLPLAVYQVSGEYAMIKAAAEKGWVDEEKIILESLLGFKRAGADMIATYFAEDAACLLDR